MVEDETGKKSREDFVLDLVEHAKEPGLQFAVRTPQPLFIMLQHN